ncbi:MAG: signal peptide peptidase SppA [Rhodospirillales bacterium]
MAFEADAVVDRRRLKRRLFVWRTLAIVGVLAFALYLIDDLYGIERGDHVARLSVEGLITDDRPRDELLADIADDPRAKALIVSIDSPGGTVVGGETLYKSLRQVAEKKPVVAVAGQLATSAGYMIALGADRIYAHDGTITGSIGVILQTTEFSELLSKIGVSAEAIKSGPLKAEPNPFTPMTPAVREALQGMVREMYDMFVGMVVERRQLGDEAVRTLADGRVFTGRRAAEIGLIDAIGGEREARAWLAAERGIAKAVPIREVKPRRPDQDLFGRIDSLARKITLSERLTLDGLVSLWHPDLR